MDERLEKYRKGELSAEEAAKLEAELAKFEAFYEYMQEEVKAEELFGDEAEPAADSGALKKTIRRRWLKMALTIGAVVLAITGLALWGVPKIIDGMYYDPTAGKTAERPSDYELFQLVRNQVDAQNDPLTFITAEKTGTASYRITTNHYNLFSGGNYGATYSIQGDDYTAGDRWGADGSLSNNAYLTSYYINSQSDGPQGKIKNKLQQLPDSSWVYLDVTLSESINLQQLKELEKKFPDSRIFSAAIENVIPNGMSWDAYALRFLPTDYTFMPMVQSEAVKSQLEEKYPRLMRRESVSLTSSEEELKTFLTSSLRYLKDHQKDDFDTYLARKSIEENDNPEIEYDLDEEESESEALTRLLKSLKKEPLKFSSIRLAVPKKDVDALFDQLSQNSVRILDTSLMSLNLEEDR